MSRRKHPEELSNVGLKRRVLAQCNDIRLALAIGEGLLPSLPKGVVEDAHQCVLARALSNGWSASVYPDLITLRLNHYGSTDRRKISASKIEEALTQLGYADVHAYDYTESVISVSFLPSEDMSELITRFDTDQLPELILEKDDLLG